MLKTFGEVKSHNILYYMMFMINSIIDKKSKLLMLSLIKGNKGTAKSCETSEVAYIPVDILVDI